jgi:uncharacterized protein (DUF2141 family)
MPVRRLAAAALPLAAALLGGATPVGRLEVDVADLRSAKGVVRLCLTADPMNFPRCHNDARALRRNLPAVTGRVALDGLAPGTYAVALIHDENGNHRLDTLAGIPREGFGFSRNPPVRFGPPRFSAAGFPVGGEAAVQQVRMRYFL